MLPQALLDFCKQPRVGNFLIVVSFVGSAALWHFCLSPGARPERITDSQLAARQGQELVMSNFGCRGPLLSHKGKATEVLEAHFTSARLAPKTVRSFHNVGITVPDQPADIDYVTADGKPCETAVDVNLAGPSNAQRELHLSPIEDPTGSLYPGLTMTVRGDALDVGMHQEGLPAGVLAPKVTGHPFCTKVLRIGRREWKVGPTQVVIRLTDKSSATFKILGEKGSANPFVLGGPDPDSKVPQPLTAEAVGVRAQAGDGTTSYDKLMRTNGKAPVLRVDRLTLDVGSLQANVSGFGYTDDGRPAVDVMLARLKDNPLLWGAVGCLFTSLISGIVGIISGKRSPPGAVPPVSRPRRPQPRVSDPPRPPVDLRRRRRG
jgi:hypothetical protein